MDVVIADGEFALSATACSIERLQQVAPDEQAIGRKVAVQTEGGSGEIERSLARAFHEDGIVGDTESRGELAGARELGRPFFMRQGDRVWQKRMDGPLETDDGRHRRPIADVRRARIEQLMK